MPIIHSPSARLIQVLGWDLIQELDNYLEDTAEQICAERRRLEATHHERLVPPGRDADLLRRLADVEYHLRDELSRTGRRIRGEIANLREEVLRLRGSTPADAP